MKHFLLFFLFICTQTFAQQDVKGIVLNGTDNTKLIAASVFINYSTKGTTTGVDGKFVISGLAQTGFQLIISYVGFKTVALDINAENINQFHIIKLFPRQRSLNDISIMPIDKKGWQKWGALFTGLFIGTSGFASDCTIENPRVIQFYQNKKTRVLHAYSDGAITILNNALGYKITYLLEDFRYDSVTESMYYLGYSSYEDLSTRNKSKIKRWKRLRRYVYTGSILHFMRALYNDSVREQGFDVRDKIKIDASDRKFDSIYRDGNMAQFVKINDLVYAVSIGYDSTMTTAKYVDLIDTIAFPLQKVTTFNAVKKQKTFYFGNYLNIKYKGPPYKSEISLLTDEPIIIEENGLYVNPANLLISGDWAEHRVAETLPFDYVNTE